jgi:hypothetical protein
MNADQLVHVLQIQVADLEVQIERYQAAIEEIRTGLGRIDRWYVDSVLRAHDTKVKPGTGDPPHPGGDDE